MTKAPEPTDELHPLLEGLQQIKYDENDNSAEGMPLSKYTSIEYFSY